MEKLFTQEGDPINKTGCSETTLIRQFKNILLIANTTKGIPSI